jgi:hypothetical protein
MECFASKGQYVTSYGYGLLYDLEAAMTMKQALNSKIHRLERLPVSDAGVKQYIDLLTLGETVTGRLSASDKLFINFQPEINVSDENVTLGVDRLDRACPGANRWSESSRRRSSRTEL